MTDFADRLAAHLAALDGYEELAAQAWRTLAAVLDHPDASATEPDGYMTKALQWLEWEAACGDCIEGRCHWGGAMSRRSAAAAAAGREFPEECGCRRHPFSVEVRRRDAAQEEAAARLRQGIAGYVFKCPGVVVHSPTSTVVHDSGCCTRFAALDPAEQARRGLRIPRTPIERGGE